MHEHVSKPDGAPQLPGEPTIDPARACRWVEEFVVRAWLTQALVGDDVWRHVLAGLNRKLQSVLDEASLTHVVLDALGVRQRRRVRAPRERAAFSFPAFWQEEHPS